MTTIGLRWVIHDGVERQVSDFAALPPDRRPLCLCPQCGSKVVLHLGPILRHHAAHEPGSTCPSTAPETELHLAAKFHLAAVLRTMQRIEIARICSTRSCRSDSQTVWFEDWDEVAVERQVGTRRPDVTLLRGGVPVGAVEVFVSHRVDDEKAQALEALSLPWIEVRADTVMPLAGEPWSGGPLLVANEGPNGPWKCDACRRVADAPFKVVDTDAFFRVHDYYYQSGKKFRRVYFVVETQSAGLGHRLELNVLEGDKYSLLAVEPPSDRDRLNFAYKAHHAQAAKRAVQTDSPMKWSKRGDLPYCQSKVAFLTGHLPFLCEECASGQTLMSFLSDAYFPRRFTRNEGDLAWLLREGYESLRWEAPFRKWSNKIQHGSEVCHARFGQGTVLSVGWAGPSDTADVLFFTPRRREEAVPLNKLEPLLTDGPPPPVSSSVTDLRRTREDVRTSGVRTISVDAALRRMFGADFIGGSPWTTER